MTFSSGAAIAASTLSQQMKERQRADHKGSPRNENGPDVIDLSGRTQSTHQEVD
jgi:hypothetical protein